MPEVASQTFDIVGREVNATLAEARGALETYVEQPDNVTLLERCAQDLHQVQGVLRVLEIYGAGIATGDATFQTEVPSWAEWDAAHLPRPRLVAHDAAGTVLGWSPIIRSGLKRKRKSNHKTDEVEDGGRARAIEEGVSAGLVRAAGHGHRFHSRSHVGSG